MFRHKAVKRRVLLQSRAYCLWPEANQMIDRSSSNPVVVFHSAQGDRVAAAKVEDDPAGIGGGKGAARFVGGGCRAAWDLPQNSVYLHGAVF